MKKLITLILLSTMLFACGGKTTEEPKLSDSEAFVSAWNNAGNAARTVILYSEDLSKTILFDIIDEENTAAAITACSEKDPEADFSEVEAYTVTLNEANKTLIENVANLFANANLEVIEDGEKLFASLLYKFQISDPEIVLDENAISFIVYEDLHMEVTNKGVTTYYQLAQEDFDTLKAFGDEYLEVLLNQPVACLVQKFSK